MPLQTGFNTCSCYYYHCDKIATVKLYRPNSRTFTNEKTYYSNEKKSKNKRNLRNHAFICPSRLNMQKYAKEILIKSIFLHDVSKKTCKYMKFTVLIITLSFRFSKIVFFLYVSAILILWTFFWGFLRSSVYVVYTFSLIGC